MHAPSRTFVRVDPALRILIVLSLLIACGVSHATPIRFGKNSVNVPPPAGMSLFKSIQPDFHELNAVTNDDFGIATLLYVTPSEAAHSDSLESTPMTEMRYAELDAFSAKQDEPLPDAMFDPSSSAGGDFVQNKVEGLKDAAAADMSADLTDISNLGVFRQVPWGLFYSTRSSWRNPKTGRPSMSVRSSAVIRLNHINVYLDLSSPVHDDADSQVAWTQKRISDWADAIHRANQAHGAHASMLYKATPWILLVLGLLLVYVLFIKKAKPR